jgi:hypothetical protein
MRRRPWLLAAGGITLVLVAAALWWALNPLGPGPAAAAALDGDAEVEVRRTPAGWEFSARGVEPTAGVVFYPGGRVDARSYAAYARDVAAQGPLTVVVSMPLSLAVLSPLKADQVIAEHPGIDTWVIAGHSLGGAMAARYANQRLGDVDGLLLLAAYPPSDDDISDTQLAVTDVIATRDKVLDGERWTSSRALLPADAEVVQIEGGNHAQFGDYGPQRGDGEAAITADEQRAIAVDATLKAINFAWRR